MTSTVAMSPIASLDRLRQSPPMWRLLFGVLGVNLLAAALLHPIISAAAQERPGMLMAALWAAALIAPAIAFVKALLLAAIIWAVASLVEQLIDWWRVVMVALLAELILAASGLFTATVIWLRGGPATVSSPLDLQVPQGIDIFIDLPAGWPGVINQNLGIFQVLWLLTLYNGLRRVAELPPGPSMAATLCCWLLVAGAGLIRLGML